MEALRAKRRASLIIAPGRLQGGICEGAQEGRGVETCAW